ncbi:MAG: tRNA (N6-threonylcarbamoyladenosine(37)-N6)-methyltransferase TrmO [Chloroflexota bacterium]|nr:tRNA (N6-threonylcarbamoyladenosine(37)-N6)-methyltransferase TrmO [Chloroflexota bacterium]
MDSEFEVSLRPIGRVSNAVKEMTRHGWGKVESVIDVAPELVDCLDGLSDFSHIVVLFWMHGVTGKTPVKVHPQGRDDLPLVGLFSTRAPHRPNSIGMTIVKLLECRGNQLLVVGLDAFDGSPVLDIKPYLPGDSILEAQYPDWVSKLHHE